MALLFAYTKNVYVNSSDALSWGSLSVTVGLLFHVPTRINFGCCGSKAGRVLPPVKVKEYRYLPFRYIYTLKEWTLLKIRITIHWIHILYPQRHKFKHNNKISRPRLIHACLLALPRYPALSTLATLPRQLLPALSEAAGANKIIKG